ncbi:MAG: adenosine deaminase [Pseudomonadota bacterium]
MSDWARLPKVELHLHLEGAAPPDFIRELAAEKGVALDGVFGAAGNYQWTTFAEFLACYMAACSVLDGPEAFGRLTERVLEQSAAQGVVYTEIFVCPDLCGDGDPVAWAEYFAAITGSAEAARGINARFIVQAIRDFGPERAEATARLALESPRTSAVGFGLGGEERHLAPADFARAFAIAREGGLPLTCHAGEICGADGVAATLDAIAPARIGHGVRAIEDPGVVARLRETGTVLEVCPGSNIALSVFPDWPSHPVDRLRQAGVAVTLSTDDPPYFGVDLISDYAHLAETFGWTEATFAELNRTAARAAFCDEATRATILNRLQEPR